MSSNFDTANLKTASVCYTDAVLLLNIIFPYAIAIMYITLWVRLNPLIKQKILTTDMFKNIKEVSYKCIVS